MDQRLWKAENNCTQAKRVAYSTSECSRVTVGTTQQSQSMTQGRWFCTTLIPTHNNLPPPTCHCSQCTVKDYWADWNISNNDAIRGGCTASVLNLKGHFTAERWVCGSARAATWSSEASQEHILVSVSGPQGRSTKNQSDSIKLPSIAFASECIQHHLSPLWN